MVTEDYKIDPNEATGLLISFVLWAVQVLALWLLWNWLAAPVFDLALTWFQVLGLHLIVRVALKDAVYIFSPAPAPTTSQLVQNLIWYVLVILVGYLIHLAY